MITVIIIIIIIIILTIIVAFKNSCRLITVPGTVSSTHTHMASVQCWSELHATRHFGRIVWRDSSAVNVDWAECFFLLLEVQAVAALLCLISRTYEKVTNYKYLGQTIAVENSTKQEVSIRIKAGWSVFGKYREIFLDRHIPMSLERKVFNQCVLPAMTYGCQTWSLTKALVKKLETSQRAMERRMLNVKLEDRIRNTTIRQSTRVTDIVQNVTNMKWNWAGHIARMKDNRWTIRSPGWQTEGVRLVERPKRRWRDDIVGQQGVVWTRTAKDRERWKTLAGGYFLQWKDTA